MDKTLEFIWNHRVDVVCCRLRKPSLWSSFVDHACHRLGNDGPREATVRMGRIWCCCGSDLLG